MSKQLDDSGPGAGSKAGSFGPATIARGIRRHPLLVALFVLSACAAGAAVWFFLPLPKLTAYATFQISSQPQGLISPAGDARTDFNYYRLAQVTMVKSRPVLNAAIDQPGVKEAVSVLSGRQPDRIGWLESKLLVDSKPMQEFMRVSLEGDQEAEMKTVISAVSDVYLKVVVNKEKLRRTERLNQLEAVQEKYKTNLQQQRTRLSQIAEDLGSADPLNLTLKEKGAQEQLSMAQRELSQLRSEMRRGLIEKTKMDERVKVADTRPDADEALQAEIEAAVKSDQAYKDLLARQSAAQTALRNVQSAVKPGARPAALIEKEEALAGLTKEVEGYRKNASPEQLARIKAALAEKRKQSSASLADRMVIMKDLESAIQNDVAKISKDLNRLSIGQVSLEGLKQEFAHAEKTADRVYEQIEALRPEIDAPARVQVFEEPTVALGIEGNRRLKYSLMGGGAFLLFGLGFVTFLEARNRRIVNIREVSDHLGMNVIGSVPALPRQGGRANSQADGQTPLWQAMLTESMDATRTMLVHSLHAPKTGFTVLITSALPGEGKTMLACHLATSLARAGYRTLLLDGDMRRPTVHRVLGGTRTPGLCELLRGEVSPDDAIRPDVLPGLSFVPAGIWDLRIPPTLSTTRWQTLMAQLAAGFDCVVIDSSPMLLVTDALLMARHTDGVVMSVLRNVSEVEAVAQARDRLATLGINVLGVVINGLDAPGHRAAYPYYAAPDSALLADQQTPTV
jgi:capsular exopolysaccharide synthesis family protein